MLPPVKKQRLSNRFTSFKRVFKLQLDPSTTEIMEFSEEQIKDATSFCDFYIDLVHSFNDKTKYFLSEDVVLDYFGHTIKGQKNVTSYIKNNIVNVEHLFRDAKPVHKIGFRDTHIVKLPKDTKRMVTPFFSPPKTSEPKTPTKSSSQPSTSAPIQEKNQGDGKHNRSEICSPAKRLRLCHGGGDNELLIDTDILESERDPIDVKYMVTEGYVEFRKPSLKKLQTESKWKRPCKLSIAYSSTTNQDCTIYLIIYEGNVKCRRNLLKEFDEAELSN
ncbi:hypothetical protein HHI36_011252 [Cryptolaemus montrouzieri]|uniref:Uncharacterized protein n=1 Tax=Cryptolaemus montrouzieri TaxID=559131 RepID=A0ABD2ML72_9CUCU